MKNIISIIDHAQKLVAAAGPAIHSLGITYTSVYPELAKFTIEATIKGIEQVTIHTNKIIVYRFNLTTSRLETVLVNSSMQIYKNALGPISKVYVPRSYHYDIVGFHNISAMYFLKHPIIQNIWFSNTNTYCDVYVGNLITLSGEPYDYIAQKHNWQVCES